MPKWTENQYNAIHSTGGSVLVSASAGSGKTAVLVERVINRITDEKNPVSADRMLIVTYTKLASAEMKERVNKRLYEMIKADPYNAYLRKQQIKLQSAHISTIHSFCSDLVREYFYLLDVGSDFRIAEEGELDILKNQALDEVLDSMYEKENNEDFYELVEEFSNNKNDNNLKDVVFKLYEFLRSHPFPKEWLDEKVDFYNFENSLSDSVWGKVIFDYTINAIEQALLLCKLNSDFISTITDEYLAEKLLEVCEADTLIFTDFLNKAIEKDWDGLYKSVNGYKKPTLHVKRTHTNHPDKIKFSNNREGFKSVTEALKKYCTMDEETAVSDIKALQPVVKEMFLLVSRFSSKFDELKKQKNVLDFSDLEHLTLKLLIKERKDGKLYFTDEAMKISSKFDEVMVDEYQDANEVQDIIFKALSGDDDHLFVVGDVKQSIYSFRQAMPDIFISRKEKAPLYDSSLQNYPSRIVLEKNFRSRRQITDSVNFMFKRLMSKECGDIEYNDEETLVCGADYNEVDETKVSMSFIDMDFHPDETALEVEADFVAKEIRRIMAERKVYKNGELKEPQYGDFAIIMRSTKGKATEYTKRLAQWGIPAISTVRDTFLNNREIRTILDLLRVIDNPLQDIPLLAVLMGPLYGFTADEMAEMRGGDKNRNIYLSLKAYADKSEKAKSFLDDINRFRAYSVAMPVNQLINKIYEETSYPAIIKGIYKNNLPYNNILLFKDYASSYEESGLKGLSSFVNYIDKLISQDKDLSSSVDSGNENLNAVQVISIHGSKGLEFPFVFLVNTTKKFVSDASNNVHLHKDLGFTSKRRDKINAVSYNTFPRIATSIAMKNSEKAEELRVLYVALTRAREELHMVCAKEKFLERINTVGSKILRSDKFLPYVVSEATSISDWLIMCAVAHKDGGKLRMTANLDSYESFDYNAPDWDINYYSSTEESVLEETTADTETKTKDVHLTDSIIRDIISKRLNFRYKNSGINKIPAKVSVSEISHSATNERFSKILSRPDFMSEKSMSPTERGTAVHNTLQYIDFTLARENLQKEIERLVDRGYITEKQSKVLDLKMLSELLSSEIISDVINSEKLYREFRFTTKIKASEAFEETEEQYKDIPVLVQGSVDMAYLKNGKLIIVDYKTDRVKDPEILKELYAKQLMLYRDAMEQCTPYKVDKCIIYSIYSGKFIYV